MNAHEHAARMAKVVPLLEAFEHLAAPSSDVEANPAEVLAFAVAADDVTWARAEALAGVRSPSSEATRATVIGFLTVRTADVDDPFAAFDGGPVR